MKFDEGLDAHYVADLGEDWAPEYRVSFWSQADGVIANGYVGISEADVDEVLSWAAHIAEGRAYTVWARSIWEGGKVFDVRLFGVEPPGVSGQLEPPWARR